MRLRQCVAAIGLWLLCGVTASADTLLGTYTVYYRFNAGGCFGGGNPYFCTSIAPGPIHIDAVSGEYRVDVIQINNAGAGGGGVQVWSGDSSGGTQYNPGATGVTFTHGSGQITLYYNDWVASDNDPTAWTIVTLTRLELPYAVADIGAFEEPRAINESGDVVGYRMVGGQPHALRWKEGVLTDLGTFGASGALAMNINESGQIALTLITAAGIRHALLSGDVLTDINSSTGFGGMGLTDAGDVSGESDNRPYYYSDGTVHPLPIGTCGSGIARDLTQSGEVVVGRASFGSCGSDTPAVWRDGVYQRLMPPPGVTAYEAMRVNSAGQIAGYGTSLVLFEPDGQGGYSAQDLGRLPGSSYCSPFGMNDSAVMVGICGPGNRAFVWDSTNGIRDLNDLADLPVGVVLDQAYGVTNSGLIVARGIFNGEFRAYLLTPPRTNQPPTADPGPPQTVRLGETVHLDGSGSFDDNTATNQLTYAWEFAGRPNGSTATLSGANTATPSFVPDLIGDYRIDLVVTDQGGLSSPAARVLVSPNAPPTVNAGIDGVAVVTTVVPLNGTASDSDGDPLTFQWTLTSKPAGSTAAVFNSNLLVTSFVPDIPGTYVARLVATDLVGAGAPDDVLIAATTAASYAIVQIQQASAIVAALPLSVITNAGNRNALSQFLAIATVALDSGDVATAVHKLQEAALRADGCGVRGSPDGNGSGRDWITTCSAQSEVYPSLLAALEAITP